MVSVKKTKKEKEEKEENEEVEEKIEDESEDKDSESGEAEKEESGPEEEEEAKAEKEEKKDDEEDEEVEEEKDLPAGKTDTKGPDVEKNEVKEETVVIGESLPEEEHEKESGEEGTFKKEALKDKESSRSKLLWFVIPGILLLAALGSGFFIFGQGGTGLFQPEPTPTPTEAPSPTATPTPALNRKDLKIRILNGSGTAGEASKAKSLLEGLGYTVVSTGNASSYDFTETEISIKEDKQEFLDLLKEDLAKEYSVSKDADTLDEDSAFDAVVTIGKE